MFNVLTNVTLRELFCVEPDSKYPTVRQESAFPQVFDFVDSWIRMQVYAPVEDESVPKLTWEVTTGIATDSLSLRENKTAVHTTPRAVMVSPLNDAFRSVNLHSRRNTNSFSGKSRISNRVCAMTLSTRATTTAITLHLVNKMQAGAFCVHSYFPSSVNGVCSSRTAASVSTFTPPMVLL